MTWEKESEEAGQDVLLSVHFCNLTDAFCGSSVLSGSALMNSKTLQCRTPLRPDGLLPAQPRSLEDVQTGAKLSIIKTLQEMTFLEEYTAS
jgi:hypothetical protein